MGKLLLPTSELSSVFVAQCLYKFTIIYMVEHRIGEARFPSSKVMRIAVESDKVAAIL